MLGMVTQVLTSPGCVCPAHWMGPEPSLLTCRTGHAQVFQPSYAYVDKDGKLSPEEMRAGLSHLLVKCPNSRCCYRGSSACLTAPGVSSCRSSVDFCTFRKFFLLLPQVGPFHRGIFVHPGRVAQPSSDDSDSSIKVLYGTSISTKLLPSRQPVHSPEASEMQYSQLEYCLVEA